MIRAGRAAAVLAAAVIATVPLSGAATAPAVRPEAFCIPIPMIWECDGGGGSAPSPSPTPTSTLPGLPGVPGLPALPDTEDELDDDPTAPVAPAPSPAAPVDAVPDDSAPVFTQPPAQLGSDSLSFTGLAGISIVTVPLADGSRVAALKIEADSITIDGFALTVRHDTGPSLATTADRMTLDGHVKVYLNSLTATTPDGQSLTLGADTPPPDDGIQPTLLRVTFGLVGATADSIFYSNTDQELSE